MAKKPKPQPVIHAGVASRDAAGVRTEEAMAFLVRLYPSVAPPIPREIAFQWTTQAGATSYRLLVGTASGLTDVFYQDVGYVLSYPLTLTPRHYFVNVVPMIGTAPQAGLGEREVTV